VQGELERALTRFSGGARVRVDGAGRTLVELSGYRTVPLPVPIDDELVAPVRRACGAMR